MADKIDRFDGAYRWLSNFWPVEIEYEGIKYPSVEHAYQAAKTLSQDDRLAIAACQTPGQAKRMGKRIKLRTDWESIKYDVMRELVRQKFTDQRLRERLLATGDAYLEEGNTWGDRTWGVYRGKGDNWLGKILMEIRSGLA